MQLSKDYRNNFFAWSSGDIAAVLETYVMINPNQNPFMLADGERMAS
jgi:hypothetical protein